VIALALLALAAGLWAIRSHRGLEDDQAGDPYGAGLGELDGWPIEVLPSEEQLGLESASAATPEGGVPAPFYGFCPSEGPSIERPSFVDLVNDRLSELADRSRAAIRSDERSAELRRGLSLLYHTPPDPEGTMAALLEAPDRRHDGFDHAAVAALAFGARALRGNELGDAAHWAERAARLETGDPAPYLLLAETSHRRRDAVSERRALEHAFELAPDDPGVAMALGRRLAFTGDLDLALRALEVYLTAYPHDAVLSGLRARLEIRAELLAESHHITSRGVTIWWPPEVSEELAEATLEGVIQALERAARLTRASRRQELTVFVYTAQADMLASTCAQEWARAMYDGALHLDGDELGRRGVMSSHITHESMHAQLHAVAPEAPVWLHEGLAQYLAAQHSELHDRSYRFMVEQRTWIPFSSLAGSFQVISDAGDARLAYHQSLAMVELLIERQGEGVVAEAVEQLGAGVAPQDLLDSLTRPQPLTGEDLLEFLQARLDP
jgi:tetratricopeptide (TPR) repeat protein